MEKISDTVTSVFHIAIKDNRPAVCSSGDGAIAWSDTLGLGWRFGISYNPHEWFARVCLYLDHNHSHTEQDQAMVTVSLGSTADKAAGGLKERGTVINDFGHGPPALVGSWSISDVAQNPYVSLTLTTKARLPAQPAMDPLASASSAIRHSMVSGDFVDTKFYVFSAKRPGKTAGKPRTVYANSNSIGLALLKAISRGKQIEGLAPAFLLDMTGDQYLNEDSVHDYAYEQDSDLDDDEESEGDSDGIKLESKPDPCGVQMMGSSLQPHAQKDLLGGMKNEKIMEPPAYSVSTCQMILVKDVAYKTWVSYIYFRYTGQVSFLPLKTAQDPSRKCPDDPTRPRCSPKSMYRLAVRLEDKRMQELAFRAIKEGLYKDNIIEETFSWFTAHYPDIAQHEVDRVSELRKLPEVSSALKLQMKALSLGEKPWACDVLVAIVEKLNV